MKTTVFKPEMLLSLLLGNVYDDDNDEDDDGDDIDAGWRECAKGGEQW